MKKVQVVGGRGARELPSAETDNGGLSWTKIVYQGPTCGFLTDFHFENENLGYSLLRNPGADFEPNNYRISLFGTVNGSPELGAVIP